MDIQLWLDSLGFEAESSMPVMMSYSMSENILKQYVESVIDKKDFNGHTYGIYSGTTPFSWTDARDMCEELGGHLVSINSEEEQDFLKYLALTSTSSKGLYWLGGYRNIDDQYNWYWCDGTKFHMKTGQAENQIQTHMTNAMLKCMHQQDCGMTH